MATEPPFKVLAARINPDSASRSSSLVGRIGWWLSGHFWRRGRNPGNASSPGFRWLRRGALALAILELLYLLIANFALRSGWVEHRINSRPDHFHLQWRSATTWIPGRVRVQGVSLIGQGSHDLYYASVSNCTFRVRWYWMWRREVQCDLFEAQGIDFRLSQTMSADLENAARMAFFPPIPGLESVPHRTGPRSAPDRNPWKIAIHDIRLQAIDQMWFKEVRIRGASSLRGSLLQARDGTFRTDLARYRLEPGSIAIAGNNSFTNLSVEVSGRLGPVDFDQNTDEEIYSHLSAHVLGNGELRNISLLRPKFDGRDGISLRGVGRFSMDVIVRDGRYDVGSSVTLESEKMALQINDFVWVGKARVEELVETQNGLHAARLRCKLGDLSFQRGTNTNHRLGDTEISIQSEAHDLRMIGEFQDANLSVHISPMAVPDPDVLNEFLPAALGTSFRTGSITIAAEFDRDSEQRLRGRMTMEGQQLGAILMNEEYQLDLAIAAQFHSDATRTNQLDISGTFVVCTNIWMSRLSRERQSGWHARLSFPYAVLATGPARELQGTLELALRDTRPILSVLQQQPESPGWLSLVPVINNLRGDLLLSTSTNSVSLHEINLRGNSTEILGYLDLRDGSLRGLLYVRWGIFSLGFDLRERERHWKLLAARRWYDRIIAGEPAFGRPH